MASRSCASHRVRAHISERRILAPVAWRKGRGRMKSPRGGGLGGVYGDGADRSRCEAAAEAASVAATPYEGRALPWPRSSGPLARAVRPLRLPFGCRRRPFGVCCLLAEAEEQRRGLRRVSTHRHLRAAYRALGAEPRRGSEQMSNHSSDFRILRTWCDLHRQVPVSLRVWLGWACG